MTFFCVAHSNNAREFLIFRRVLLDINWNVWVLSPFSWKTSKNIMFSFFDVSDVCIFEAECYWCYVFCWLKFLGFVDFPFQNSPILLGCSCYYGGFFWTWIETFWVLEPFLRRLQKILHFHFSTCPICIFHKGNLTNAIYFVDKNGYALLIFFSKNPSTIRMFLRLRGFLFEIVWTHFFPETFS